MDGGQFPADSYGDAQTADGRRHRDPSPTFANPDSGYRRVADTSLHTYTHPNAIPCTDGYSVAHLDSNARAGHPSGDRYTDTHADAPAHFRADPSKAGR